MIFIEEYLRQLNQSREALTDEVLPFIPLPEGVMLERPERTPEKVWETLSAPQRFRTSLQSLAGRVKSGELGLSEVDCLRLVNPQLEVSDRAAEIIIRLTQISLNPQKNSTLPELVRYVAEAEQKGEALNLAVSHCLKKSEEIRPGKLAYFLLGDKQQREVKCFTEGVEAKGWDRINRIIREINYPIEITLLLGDMDLLTLDGCAKWCSPRSLERLPFEIAERRNELTRRVGDAFGADAPVRVGLWSERYSQADFEQALERARNLEIWSEAKKLFEDTRQMYRNDWKYGRIERELNLLPTDLDRFIQADLCRTAAQYRLESDILMRSQAIQGWAESVPKSNWPIRISGYDGRATAPSLLLV